MAKRFPCAREDRPGIPTTLHRTWYARVETHHGRVYDAFGVDRLNRRAAAKSCEGHRTVVMETGDSIMKPSELSEWAESKACGFHRSVGGSPECNNPVACEKALQASKYLRRLKRFQGTRRIAVDDLSSAILLRTRRRVLHLLNG